jgi:hypothetical protein
MILRRLDATGPRYEPHMRFHEPRNQRRRIAMAAWIALAVGAFAQAAFASDPGAQFVFVLFGCILLLCFWAAVRWPSR